jgi:hypothetical protein
MRYQAMRLDMGKTYDPRRNTWRLKFEHRTKDESLPVKPMRDWITRKLEMYTPTELARACQLFTPEGEPDVRRISSIFRVEKNSILFSSVDHMLTREGSTFIWDLYPEEYDRLLAAQ